MDHNYLLARPDKFGQGWRRDRLAQGFPQCYGLVWQSGDKARLKYVGCIRQIYEQPMAAISKLYLHDLLHILNRDSANNAKKICNKNFAPSVSLQ
jgi:hypothetical protein